MLLTLLHALCCCCRAVKAIEKELANCAAAARHEYLGRAEPGLARDLRELPRLRIGGDAPQVTVQECE